MPATVFRVPHHADPLAATAAALLERHARDLPDLTRVTVLLPEAAAVPELRRALAAAARARGLEALLGPFITTLSGWAREAAARPGLCRPQARLLVLADALRRHPALLGQASPWAVAAGLLELFDQLTRNLARPDESLEDFTRRLREAYGMDEAGAPAGFVREAHVVHTLWRAWHEELAGAGLADPVQAWCEALARLAATTGGAVWAVGLTRLAASEREALGTLAERGLLTVVVTGADAATPRHPDAAAAETARALAPDAARRPPPADPGPPPPVSQVLDAVFAGPGEPLAARAAAAAARWPESPLVPVLSWFGARDPEEEARAVELQVRRWLLDGARHVAVVTEDRRLARRVRALLERAGISLADAAGWALSTTAAAAVLERWLQCVEEDFAWLPLLDLLKSPFLPGGGRPEHADAVRRLERDIVHRENVAAGLERYRRTIDARLERLQARHGWTPATAAVLKEILDRLEEAARPLAALRGGRHPAPRWLAALDASLATLGLDAGLAADAAGSRVADILRRLAAAARQWPLALSWTDFRGWLAQALEGDTFRPAETGSGVRLLTPAQAALLRFDAVAIAGADRGHLPVPPAPGPFFNDAVARALGLPTRGQDLARQLHHFRALLEAAPRVLVTACVREDGEPVPPGPWVELLQSFHRLAWGTALDSDLGPLLRRPGQTLVQRCPDATLPAPRPRPRPVLTAVDPPPRLSASAYQTLVDCPYRFYAQRCLNLAAPEEIQLALAKADYGGRVHTCLQALHEDVDGLPGPWPGPWDAAHARDIEAVLEHISEAVFRRDLETHFEHLGWYRRWLRLIPTCVQWEIERAAQGWRVAACELALETALEGGPVLTGRLDRVDRRRGASGTECMVLDYKTGTIASGKDVAAGEAVQLPFYALLLAEAGAAAFVDVDKPPVKTKTVVAGEELAALAAAHRERLRALAAALGAGAALPAWGDAGTCKYCEMDRLCRRTHWLPDGEEA